MKYTEEKAIEKIRNNGGVVAGGLIEFSRLPGIKIWGCVDFLVNYKRYRLKRG